MRRFLILVLLAAFIVPAPQAHARNSKAKTITFETVAPCAGACPHWTAPSNRQGFENACAKDPVTVPGSWDDHKIKVPARINGRKPYAMVFTLSPVLEYDGFVCKVINAGKPNERYKFIVTSGNDLHENCDAVFFGCPEKVQFIVRPGQTFVLRAYNWSDGPTCVGTYSWVY